MLFVILLLLMILFSVDDTTYWWYYFLFWWYYFIADDTTFRYTYSQASDLWLQLELASQLEYDLCDTVDLARNWLVNFDNEKIQLV